MAIYLAADEPLPFLDDQAGAVLYTTALRDENDRAVRGHFTKPHVVYAGSYEGCGCGFFKLEHAEYAEPEDVEACRKSLSALAEYLQDALVRCGSVELFTCWEGDQPQPATHRGVATPSEIAAGILSGTHVNSSPSNRQSNKPIERPGVNPRADVRAASAGRSAPSR